MQINGELCISAEGEGMAEIAFKYWREKEQSAEVSKKGSKTPPLFRTKYRRSRSLLTSTAVLARVASKSVESQTSGADPGFWERGV